MSFYDSGGKYIIDFKKLLLVILELEIPLLVSAYPIRVEAGLDMRHDDTLLRLNRVAAQ